MRVMDDLIRTTCYLTAENKELWRKASYLTNTTKSSIINKVLKDGFEKVIDELEKEAK
jgi:hypothetical protein